MANVGEVCKLLGVSGDTLRRWSDADHFGMFLSPGATPPKGEERFYNEHDLRVVHYISTARKNHTSLDDIRQRLNRMRDSGWAGLPDVPESWKRATGGEVPVKDVSNIVAQTAELATLQTQVSHLREERDNALERADTLQRELDHLRTTERTTESRLHALEVEIEQERGRIRELEAKLSAYDITGRGQPMPVALIVVSALVAGAVLVALALVLARVLL